MKPIYNLIKEEIVSHRKVLNSVLGNQSSWKRSHYTILSDIICSELENSEYLQGEKRFELGTTISHITLQRFFESDYDEKTHNDLRFLKTLDKICIFLGFEDLNDYIQFIKVRDKNVETETEFNANIIYKYCSANFEFFKGFPNRNIDVFTEYIFSDSPFWGRIDQFSKELCEKGIRLVTDNNRSNFEIFDVQILSDSQDKKVLKTQEFWNLLFEVENTKEEIFVHELNSQTYFIRKRDDVWKIWDNHNPNAGLLNKSK